MFYSNIELPVADFNMKMPIPEGLLSLPSSLLVIRWSSLHVSNDFYIVCQKEMLGGENSFHKHYMIPNCFLPDERGLLEIDEDIKESLYTFVLNTNVDDSYKKSNPVILLHGDASYNVFDRSINDDNSVTITISIIPKGQFELYVIQNVNDIKHTPFIYMITDSQGSNIAKFDPSIDSDSVIKSSIYRKIKKLIKTASKKYKSIFSKGYYINLLE